MTTRARLLAVLQDENLNFLLTNRIPRRAATKFVGWLSKIENPLVRDVSLAVWKTFSDLDLAEAKKTSFRSMHDCFIRELKSGVRPIDPSPTVFVSPCDGIVGAAGRVDDGLLFQIKGFPYRLRDLFDDDEFVRRHRNAHYITLRLTSSMYHRFHAPHDCRIDRVDYLSGDTWNVNPIALRRVEKLFCKNERAVIRGTIGSTGDTFTLVAVAAILVASIRLNCLGGEPDLRKRSSTRTICNADYRKGDEMGWFEHGSTIIVFAPAQFQFPQSVREGALVKMGQPLFEMSSSHAESSG